MCTIPSIDLPPASAVGRPSSPAVRQIHLQDGWQTASVWQRDQLYTGQGVVGPAIIEQEDPRR